MVYVVDDDAGVRDSLELLLTTAGHKTRTFESPEVLLDSCSPQWAGCVVTDLQMPGLSGLELQAHLAERDLDLPVIVLTGFGEVSSAVQAMKAGAVDFLEKPFTAKTLLAAVRKALAEHARRVEQRQREGELRARLDELTAREREVMSLVVDGAANKVVAQELGISERTVEIHRSRVMKKTGCRSVAELVRLVRLDGDSTPSDIDLGHS